MLGYQTQWCLKFGKKTNTHDLRKQAQLNCMGKKLQVISNRKLIKSLPDIYSFLINVLCHNDDVQCAINELFHDVMIFV